MLRVFEYYDNGFKKYQIEIIHEDTPYSINVDYRDWNKSVIVDKLIRTKYSQDSVEAIINNHFINIAEWIELKFKNKTLKFEDPEYEAFQGWRVLCKEWASKALEEYPEV